MGKIVDSKAFDRIITRLSHEIVERNKGTENVCLLGIKTRGIPIAKKIADKIKSFEGVDIPVDSIDITFYRDDLTKKNIDPVVKSQISLDVENKIIVLVDDVLYTGRTCRAAIDAVMEVGRPSKVQLAIIIDRGHRELPIRPDFIGKNVPTSKTEIVHVMVDEIDGINQVVLEGGNYDNI